MAVTNNATVIEDFEGAGPTFSSVGGGSGAGLNTDVFIAGSQAGGRRSDSKTGHGFFANPGTTFDISGAGEHVKFYYWVTHYPLLTALELRIGSATTAYEGHTVTVAEYPPLGGWFPIWLEVDSGTDSGSPNFTTADEFGVVISIGNVGGNAQNSILDQIHHSTRPVLTWDGSTGDFADFSTTDDTNALGTLIVNNGVYFLYANLQIGSATATTFTDSGVVIVAPDFSHLPTATTWQGIDVDLQNASTVVTWTGSVYGASDPANATRKPDLIVTGTSGTADFSDNRFQGLRIATFTSGVTCENVVLAFCGTITHGGASMNGSSVVDSAVAADTGAVVYNVAADPDGEMDNMTFSIGANAHHAIEFGTSAPATMTLRGMVTTGFNAADAQNDSTFLFPDTGSDVDWTLNIIGGTGEFSFKKVRGGDTVTIVIDPVTTTVTVLDENAAALQNANVLMEAGGIGGDLPYEVTVTITASGTTASVSHTAHGLPLGEKVTIRNATQHQYNGVFAITNVTTNAYDYVMGSAPTSPATIASGKTVITSTGVIVEGLTSILGVVTASRTFSVDQPARYRVRKSTTTPRYVSVPRTSWLTATVDNASGLSISLQMVRDD